MIELIPAIDIINGKCVRLEKGDYSRMTVYNEDPVEQALEFQRKGFKRLHVVDLDGARSEHIVNADMLRGISEAAELAIDFGGGIKSDNDIEKVFSSGAQMAAIGSVAVTRPEKLKAWIADYGAERIILCADVRNGKISIHGWTDDTSIGLIPFLEEYTGMGIRKVLCTDVSRDGMLQGPSIEMYKEVMSLFPDLYLIASGGVSSNGDIERLEKAGVPAVVFGKAYYEGKISF